jgi:cellobiose phosphorylase
MDYGVFDDLNREYVITDPRTPTKWINYIGTLDFGGFVDHTGGALICKQDPTFNRITKYLQQAPSSDFKGETLYLRINHPRNSIVFSPFYVPTLDQYDRYECHVGLGYTRIISEFYGLRTEVTIFALGAQGSGNREIRDIQITNISQRLLDVDAIPVVEYTHPDALKQFTNADWVPQTMQSRAVKDGDFTILIQFPFMYKDSKLNYFTSNLSASSYETDRKIFLGANEYGTWAKPLGLQNWELSNTEINRGDNIVAMMHHLGRFRPGETRRLITQLGQEPTLETIQSSVGKYRQSETVATEFGRLATFWDSYLETFQVDTPDAAMNSMLNIHNPHQCFITKTWSRYLSYYQLGLGARGIGIRDSTQDVLAIVAALPEDARAFIKILLSFQKRDGSAMHQFNPLTMEGSEGDALERDDRPHFYSDDHLWGILGVTSYLKETGDFAFLDEIIPFYDKDKSGYVIESASVLEHLKRSLRFTKNHTGQHGLPLLGFADWNDTINLPSGAESLFSTHLYGRALNEFCDLLECLGQHQLADEYRKVYNSLKERFEASAWDGNWYVMYFNHDGIPLGSHKNVKGQIHLNGQSWAVLSGFASPKKAQKAMDAVYSRLNTKFGLKLSAPGYNCYDPKVGGVTTYPPGAKENGGIFLHPNPWAIIAETILGNGERAFEYYSQINPAGKNDLIDLYESEPYVYPQNILGDEHPQFGLARNSWLSGTASWCYLAGTQYILGVRAEYNGLRVDPCIPSSWSGFTTVRRFRGSLMRITVYNEQHVCKGVTKISIDNKPIQGNLIPLMDGGEHIIEVWMGKYG